MAYMSFDQAAERIVRAKDAVEAYGVWQPFEDAMANLKPEAREELLMVLSRCWCGPGRGSCGFSALYSLVDSVLTIAGKGAVGGMDNAAFYGNGNSVFAGREDIRRVVIGEGVTCIDHGTFEGCGMESLVLPESLEWIGSWAFTNCPNLTAVTVPDGTRRIGDRAFAECEQLQRVTLRRREAEIAPDAFPEGCRLDYAE